MEGKRWQDQARNDDFGNFGGRTDGGGSSEIRLGAGGHNKWKTTGPAPHTHQALDRS
jgi:hypothetical protein